MQATDTVKQLLEKIYGRETGARAFERIIPLINAFPVKAAGERRFFTETDVVLITYGDTLRKEGEAPLVTLRRFAEQHLKGAVSTIHFLPFFPFSSDDGFSVKDFYAINPELGTWSDVTAFAGDFKLMFDYVLNHISAGSPWFRRYLAAEPGFEQLAIEIDPATDLSGVTRPRSLPLLTEFRKGSGETVHVWTTFSADQIDLNFKCVDVLVRMIEVLLFYVRQGAAILRQDAIAYLWKEVGTSCIHLEQTHAMVKLFRSILDRVAPEVMILTETNVPHAENISYFGNGYDEAQMVYNFTLPPLLFHTFVNEDAAALTAWAGTLQPVSENTTFFNFTASHDGIGVRPLEGILAPEQIGRLVAAVNAGGGRVSYKRNADGSESPYELNLSYVDAIMGDPNSNRAGRFLASQAVQYVLPGVPATYIHSLLGSRNWIEGVARTGRARSINREKLRLEAVLADLERPQSFRSRIFYPYLELIKIRRKQRAFHPGAAFEILDMGPRMFAVRREGRGQIIFALTNVSSRPIAASLAGCGVSGRLTDLISGDSIDAGSFTLAPYQYRWLEC